jgi:exosortase A
VQRQVHIHADEAIGAEINPSVLDEQLISAATRRARDRLQFWRHEWVYSLVVFGLSSILLLWRFWSEVAAAFAVWTSSQTFGHALFVFPVTLFLFYRLRHHLAALRPKAAPWALVPMAGAALCWAIGDLANLMVVKQLAFVAIWQSLFLLVFGWQVAGRSLFPLAYLYLAVPFGLSLIPALQDVTAQIVVYLLRFGGVPVFLNGYHIEIPTGSFLVAEACSGVRYLMVCIALGTLAAYLFFRSWLRRTLFVALSIVVPIVANGIRAYSIIMIAHHGGHEFARDFDHVLYGFAFLSLVTLVLLALGALLRDRQYTPRLDPVNSTISSQASVPVRNAAAGRFVQAACAALALIALLSMQTWTEVAKAPPPNTSATLRAPVLRAPWVLESTTPAWRPTLHGADAELQQGYRRGEERVVLNVAYYAYQREGAEVVSDLNMISSSSEVQVLRARQMKLEFADVLLPVNELVVAYDGQPVLVWHWYWVDRENTNSRMAAKLLEMKALATGSERAAAIIAVTAEVSDNIDGTVELIKSFLQEGFDDGGALFQVETPSGRAVVGSPPPPAGRALDP